MNRTKYDSFHRFYRQWLVNARYLHETVAMISETGKNRFLTAFGDVNILGHGTTDILKHDHTCISCIFR